jgi:L-ascorbate metabolism protein UlaG (beta-lactamase superfamily)
MRRVLLIALLVPLAVAGWLAWKLSDIPSLEPWAGHVLPPAAVIVVHSHYDHAMDAPEVARRSGALLVGSESTANVGRGWGLEEARIRVPRGGERMPLGSFGVTLIGSEHFPHGVAMGEIGEPLVPPASALDYLEGGSFSVLIEHRSGTLLVQGSAGWRDGALAGREADVVLLGIGGLGSRAAAYRAAYWARVVEAVSPRMVIPIHWDDFTRSLDEAPAADAAVTRRFRVEHEIPGREGARRLALATRLVATAAAGGAASPAAGAAGGDRGRRSLVGRS